MPFFESSSSIYSISSSLNVFIGFGLVQGRFFGLVCKIGGKLGLFFFLCLFLIFPLGLV